MSCSSVCIRPRCSWYPVAGPPRGRPVLRQRCKCRPVSPKRRTSQSAGARATSPTQRSPQRSSRCCRCGRPQRRATGRGCRKEKVLSGGTTVSPSGLLGRSRPWPRTCRGGADRDCQAAGARGIASLDAARHEVGCSEQSFGAGHVEKRPVQAQRLDHAKNEPSAVITCPEISW